MANLQQRQNFGLDDPQGYDCTPSSLLASTPCLSCLSEHDMLAVIVGIFAVALDKTIPEIMDEGACFSCMSKKQMLQALATILGNQLLGEEHTAQEVIDEMHCLVCVPDQQLLAAILRMFCYYLTITPTQR